MSVKPLFAVLLMAATAAAQPSDPPPLVQLIERPGIGGGSVRDYATVHADVDVLALTSMTGAPKTWQIEMHSSFASIEALDRALVAAGYFKSSAPAPSETDLATAARALIGIYQPALSYRPKEAVALLPKARYFHVSVFQIRPGSDADFADLMRLRRQKMDSVNLDRPDLIYRVVSGSASSTYVVLAPMTSLKILDDGIAALPAYAEAVAAAEAQAGKQTAAADLNRENLLFRVDPGQSYVSDDFAAADSGFWRPKAQAR